MHYTVIGTKPTSTQLPRRSAADRANIDDRETTEKSAREIKKINTTPVRL